MARKDFTLAEKIALLDQIECQPPSTSQRQLAEITGVPKSTIGRLKKHSDQLRQEWASRGQIDSSQSKKRKREGKDPDVDEALNEWFSIVTGRGVRVSGPMLKTKAEELASKLGHEFKATDGWLSRWKVRREIKFKKAHGEKDSADIEGAEDWKSSKLPNFLEKYDAGDIYNADETGLFYRATPDGSLCYKRTALSGSKKAMERITVLCCSNMAGTDKQKLLVIGKSAKPRCFKGLRMDSLPVHYYANKNAWMTSQIFKEWLLNWDRKLQQNTRKILLLVDNCAAHPILDCLKNIQLEFLPPNTTSLVQPMDMGIIKNLKTFYRQKLVNHVLEAIEENLLKSSSTAKEVSAKVSILQAIQFVADSWRKIKSTTIENCFAHCGFKHSDTPIPNTPNNSETNELPLHVVQNYEEFVAIDSNLDCYDGNEDCEDTIVAKIMASKTQETSQESDEDEASMITNRDARKSISILQRYFMQEGNEGCPIVSLDMCADFVHNQSMKNRKQSTLDIFFKNT